MRWFFVFLVLLQCLLLAGLGFLPTDLIPYHEILPQDKTLHFTGFLILTFLVFFIWDHPQSLYNILLTALPVSILAFGSEIFQPILSPTRTYDSHDIEANATGAVVGLCLAILVDYFRKARYSRTQVRYETLEMV
ncbi:hypothetical protein BX616_009309 [Lobosporangium transversale]|uniref:VanZ-like domain-containing protein n=1 Tax=Lobosporangium transversale TaxID=64571 RepID=A0A1Y2GQI7_9FUNG|nr:hypothetical protein BCR41DRAFT_351578 [Lobosporangium transversale]KAF9913917.1 hypothetical protein BX616_009309 [Lobosporangium transversale]ORZ19124.1 hypothetical protein BCR41DRAFT_351578 [Lobosporangium transversale]|eukprot:XP_021882292.1 hypothetical protein BCR41DRAFT_351578 [Lobosporangium transversale]